MDSLRTVPDKEAFWLKENEWKVVAKADSIRRLLEELRRAPPGVIYHHLADGRNDFANWVENVFREEALAGRLRQILRTDPEAQKKTCAILESAVSKMGSRQQHNRHT